MNEQDMITTAEHTEIRNRLLKQIEYYTRRGDTHSANNAKRQVYTAALRGLENALEILDETAIDVEAEARSIDPDWVADRNATGEVTI